MTVYLLHFSRPIRGKRHYIGITNDLDTRFKQHVRWQDGSALTQKAKRLGIEVRVARTWENADHSFERTLKRRKDAKRLCPLCVEDPAGPGLFSSRARK